MTVGLVTGPVEQAGATVRPVSRRWIGLFVALAAGWGMLFGYSMTFLSEDLPFRSKPEATDPPAFAFTPLPHPLAIATAAQLPDAPKPHVVVEPVPVVAPAPPGPAARVERPDYVGTWGPTEAACGKRSRRRGYIPATITPERASAGRTICSFHDGRRNGNAWTMAADCAERGRRWSSQVRLVVDGDRLTWTSGKGSASYVRCGRRAG